MENFFRATLRFRERFSEAAWFFSFLLVQSFSAIFFQVLYSVNRFNLFAYILSFATSLSFWYLIYLFSRLFPPLLAKTISSLVGIFLSLLLFISIFVYIEFREFVSVNMLSFVFEDINYFVNYPQTYLFNKRGVTSILVAIFFSWLWLPPSKKPRSLSGILKKAGIFLGVFLSFAFFLTQTRFVANENLLSFDTSLLVALQKISRNDLSTKSLHYSDRQKITPLQAESVAPKTILLVINESWGKRPISFYGYPNNPMPFLDKWIKKERNHFYVFSNFFSNSSATDVSIPSILTGVVPYESNEKLHEMPLLWDWAKSAGYKTVLVSAQRWKTANLAKFAFSESLDLHLTAEDIDAPIINDIGKDDMIVVKHLANYLKEEKGPVFAIYNSNSLHPPFQQKSSQLAEQPKFRTRYENALFILDKTIEQIHRALEESNRFKDSLIIFTGDHGEGILKNPMPRLYSFYDEVMCVPFLIRTPKYWLTKYPGISSNLRQNQFKMAQNIDIAPTIADVFGLNNLPKNNRLIENMLGDSLLDFLRQDRVVISLNTNFVRTWNHEGFGIYWKNRRFVFSDVEKEKFFDIVSDPQQMNDFWHEIPYLDKQKIQSMIANIPQLRRIYEAH